MALTLELCGLGSQLAWSVMALLTSLLNIRLLKIKSLYSVLLSYSLTEQ